MSPKSEVHPPSLKLWRTRSPKSGAQLILNLDAKFSIYDFRFTSLTPIKRQLVNHKS